MWRDDLVFLVGAFLLWAWVVLASAGLFMIVHWLTT